MAKRALTCNNGLDPPRRIGFNRITKAGFCCAAQIAGDAFGQGDFAMQTIFDWVTMAIFSGLVVIFLQRSVGDDEPVDSIWSYLPAAAGCAIANQIGNHVSDILGAASIALVLAYIWFVIKPFPLKP